MSRSELNPLKRTIFEIQEDITKAQGQYLIPEYQRDYAWSKKTEGVQRFIEDVFQLMNENTDHFFNSTVFIKNKENGYIEIVDGQQRFITIFLFLTAKSTIFKGNFALKDKQLKFENKYNQSEPKIENLKQFFKKTDDYGYNFENKITMNECDNCKNFIRTAIICIQDLEEDHSLKYIASYRNIIENFIEENSDLFKKYTSTQNYEELFDKNLLSAKNIEKKEVFFYLLMHCSFYSIIIIVKKLKIIKFFILF
ncbi:DUF262 domain-containing protein [Lentisphaerota bacterium WC36G]|nr:DUF262 domain-containing protein [Lentisphaerae bacterium WC36]